MRQRGRKSLVSHLKVVPIPRARRVARLREGASPEVAAVFQELVASSPSGHFQPSDDALLEQYAQSVLLCRKAYGELESGGPVVDGKASPWLVVYEKATRASCALAARLRLAPQMRADARTAGRRSSDPTPSVYDAWQDR